MKRFFTPAHDGAIGCPLVRRRSLLLGLLACAAVPARARPAALPLPIPLAQEAPPDVDPRGYLVSEKYDGVRAVWDGRAFRFRSGLPIVAPAWFIERLPAVPLDGELWLGRGRFEALAGAVRRVRPDDAEWRQISYMVFDLPSAGGGFAERSGRLVALARETAWPALQAVPQRSVTSRESLRRWLDELVANGGEGLVLRRSDAPYQPGRTAAMLKLKPLSDAEATVLGVEPGRGQHTGVMGALRVRTPEGIEFKLGTGFSDSDRVNPPAIGARVTYVYRGLTKEGVPRFASFLRVRGADL